MVNAVEDDVSPAALPWPADIVSVAKLSMQVHQQDEDAVRLALCLWVAADTSQMFSVVANAVAGVHISVQVLVVICDDKKALFSKWLRVLGAGSLAIARHFRGCDTA